MQEIIKFLGDSRIFYLATSDGSQPHVRPMGFVMEYNGKLCFCTGNPKDMYKQMKANPKVEFCAVVGTDTLRITGSVEFITTPEAKRKALDAMPELKNLYSVDDGVFEIFALSEGIAVFVTMQGEKKAVKI